MSKADRLRERLGATQQRTADQDQSRKQAHETAIPGLQEGENAVFHKNENEKISKNANKKMKRATFEFEEDFHAELKIFAARNKKKMVDVVVQAIREHMSKN
ncbi:hypothetical protein HP567_029685 (plasmid) [Brevibacillus sp. M2.1A]|uniref:hypothetical protein n=1 Tax=Brevibacillus sp. M2.1A TaxID=2738980 RepID=UPI00156ABA99|nr:hypothetical protein [Brevibacillus sp. M2.1A]MCC8438708.1 hypothetical protein [Brevibacillus sp. M2.1A]